jgi:alkylation response protein AidB-like acyl-CoA dehydrogenase
MFDPADEPHHNAAIPKLCQQTLEFLPRWRERAASAEKNRRLSKVSFDELFTGGWIDLLTPRHSVATPGHWPTMVETSRIAARACASTGWMISLVGGHGLIARRLPPDCQSQLYADGPRQLFASASTSTNSQLSLETEGMRVNGRWRFSSGIQDATWLILNAPCANHPDAQRFLLLIAAREVEVVDSWDSCGMSATGSHDILTRQLLVPHERVFSLHEVFAQRPPSIDMDYIDCLPLVPYLTTSIIGPVLGCAEGAYASFVAALASQTLAIDTRIAEQVSHAAAQLYGARLLYDSLVSRLHEAGVHNQALDARQLLILKRDRAYLARMCVQAVHCLVQHLGASSMTASNPVQRHWRDIQAMAAHRDLVWSDAMLACGDAILQASKHFC